VPYIYHSAIGAMAYYRLALLGKYPGFAHNGDVLIGACFARGKRSKIPQANTGLIIFNYSFLGLF
jgi:hypothetical protein